MCVSEGKKCSFFGKCDVLCFLENKDSPFKYYWFEFIIQPWNIYANEQYRNCDLTHVFGIVVLFLKLVQFNSRAQTDNFFPALLII